MLGLLAVALVGVPLGLAAGGSLRGWSSVRVRWAPALLVAFGAELILYNPPIDHQAWALTWGPLIWIASKLIMLAVFVRNTREQRVWIWPWLIAAVGITLNTFVISVNGGYMPQSIAAREAVWGPNASQLWDQPHRLYNVTPMTADTNLSWLGDVIAEPQWFLRPNVVSLGDLLLASGICGWAYCVTTSERRRRLILRSTGI